MRRSIPQKSDTKIVMTVVSLGGRGPWAVEGDLFLSLVEWTNRLELEENKGIFRKWAHPNIHTLSTTAQLNIARWDIAYTNDGNTNDIHRV